jgi:hypothetical protein
MRATGAANGCGRTPSRHRTSGYRRPGHCQESRASHDLSLVRSATNLIRSTERGSDPLTGLALPSALTVPDAILWTVLPLPLVMYQAASAEEQPAESPASVTPPSKARLVSPSSVESVASVVSPGSSLQSQLLPPRQYVSGP